VRITNESNLAVKVSGITAGGGEWQPGYTEYMYRGSDKAPLSNRLVLTGENISSSGSVPSTVILLTIYLSGDFDIPEGNWPIPLNRLTNIGNGVLPLAATSIVNDGNSLATSIIEATPTGQATSSWAMNNDASGFIKVLSANVMRTILNVVRGDTGATKAIVTFGDSGDRSIFTYQGTLGIISSDAGKIVSNGSGKVTWANTLSSGNQLMDLQQGYGVFSDNATAGLGTTRLWINGPDRGEIHLAPRVGADYFDQLHVKATRVTFDCNHNTSSNTEVFEVQGGHVELDNAKIVTDGTGKFTKLANVAAVGFGLPVVVAQALDTNVTATGNQTILTYATVATGLYRVSGGWHFANGTTPQNVTFRVTYADSHGGAIVTSYFLTTEDPSRALNAKAIAASPFSAGLVPASFHALTGTNITVSYNDAGGTPNDFVTVIIERLA